jgi:hypothetical protein
LKKGRIFEVILGSQQTTYITGIIGAKWPYVQTKQKNQFAALRQMFRLLLVTY